MKVFLGAFAVLAVSGVLLALQTPSSSIKSETEPLPTAKASREARPVPRFAQTLRPGDQTEGSRSSPVGLAKVEARNRTSDALALVKSGDTAAALRLLEQITREEPLNQKAFAELGYLLAEATQSDRAISVLQSAVKLDPNDGESLQALSDQFLRTNRVDEGVDFFKSLPDDSASRFALGDLLLKTGRPKEALGYLEKYAESQRTPLVLSALGAAFLQTGDSESAGRTFKEVEALRQAEANEILESNKEDPAEVAQQMAWTKLDLANVHLQEGNWAEAQALVDHVLTLFPDDKAALEMKTKLKKRQGT